MPQERVGRHSHYNLNYHLVFTPKFRRRVLVGEVAALVKAEVRAACAARDWLVLALEVMPDHLHLFVSCPPKWAPSDMAKILKGVTARAALKAFPQLRARGHFWTNALSCNLYQSKFARRQYFVFCPIILHFITKVVKELLPIISIGHVYKIYYNNASHIAQAQLSGYFCSGD